MPRIEKKFIACKDAAHATVGKFYEFKNATETSVDLYFYGDIVSDWWGAWQEEDQYPEAIKNFLAEANGKDLNIYINSGGGSIFAGIAIYNMLKRYPGKKTVHVDALAGSIASVIAFADSEAPTIPSNAYLMIHKPWAGCEGNAIEMRKMADTLDAVEAGILSVYEEHLAEGVDIKTVKKLMEEETWLDGTKAAEYFQVKVGEENTIAAAVQDFTKMYCRNAPKDLVGAGTADNERLRQQDQEKRKSIIALTMAHMGR